MTFPLHNIAIKVAKCTIYAIKVYNFFRFLVCTQYFKFFFNLHKPTSEIEVIKCCNQNMAVLLNVIASTVNTLQMKKNWGIKAYNSDFGYVSNISTLPLIMYVDKRNGGCKIPSRYFSKWSRYRALPTHP